MDYPVSDFYVHPSVVGSSYLIDLLPHEGEFRRLLAIHERYYDIDYTRYQERYNDPRRTFTHRNTFRDMIELIEGMKTDAYAVNSAIVARKIIAMSKHVMYGVDIHYGNLQQVRIRSHRVLLHYGYPRLEVCFDLITMGAYHECEHRFYISDITGYASILQHCIKHICNERNMKHWEIGGTARFEQLVAMHQF